MPGDFEQGLAEKEHYPRIANDRSQARMIKDRLISGGKFLSIVMTSRWRPRWARTP